MPKITNTETLHQALANMEIELEKGSPVSPELLFKQVSDQYNLLTLKYHPEQNKEPDAAKNFKTISNAYLEFATAFEDGTLNTLLSATSSYPAAEEDRRITRVIIRDSTKNALFDYYKDMGLVLAQEKTGPESLRAILTTATDISAMAFNLEAIAPAGYEVLNCSFSTKAVLASFISSIGNDYAQKLKNVSFMYPLAADQVIAKLGIDPISDPDQISI